MMRVTWWLSLPLLAAGALGQSDPAFESIPFDDWLKDGSGAHIDWNLTASPPVLAEIQRLRTSVIATVDGSELIKRSEPGELTFFLEIRHRGGRTYQTHRQLQWRRREAMKAAEVKLTEEACVLPGDYEIIGAIYDSRSSEHSLKRTRLRVPELRHDPLPDPWRGLPAVEGISACYGSELSIHLTTQRPVRMDVIVNTPADPGTSIAADFKVISEIEIANGSMTAIRLDLHDRTVKEQSVTRGFDIKSFLNDVSGDSVYKVDVHAIDTDSDGERFFLSEIQKRVALPAPGAEHILVILSGRVSAPKVGELPSPPPPPRGTHVYYVRCDPPPRGFFPPPPGVGRSERENLAIAAGDDGGDTGVTRPPINRPFPKGPPPKRPDSLEPILTELRPRLFDVATPIEFRKALADMMAEIANSL